MKEKALLFQIAHRVADGRRRHAEPEPARQRPRSGGLGSFDVAANHRFQYAAFASAELLGCHKFKASNDFGRVSSRRRARRAGASPSGVSAIGRSAVIVTQPASTHGRSVGQLASPCSTSPSVVRKPRYTARRPGCPSVSCSAAVRRDPRRHSSVLQPLGVGGDVPAAGRPVELVRRRPEPGIRDAAPVGRVVPRAPARTTEVRDLVVLEARIGQTRRAHAGTHARSRSSGVSITSPPAVPASERACAARS